MQDVACTNCRNRKIRCGRERPRCGSCSRDRVDCVYSSPAKRVNHVKVLCQGFDDIQSRLRLVQDELATLTAMFKNSRIADGYPINMAPMADGSSDVGGRDSDLDPSTDGHLVRDDGTSLEKYHGPWTLLALCRDFGLDLTSHFGHDSVPGKLVGQMWLDAGNDIRRGLSKADSSGRDAISLPSRQFLSVVLDSFFSQEDPSTDIFVRSTFQKAMERAYSEPSDPASEAWAVCFNLIILLVIGAEQGIGKQPDPFIQPLLQAAHAATQKPTIFLSLRLVNVQALSLLSLLAQQSHSETLGDGLFAQACTLAKAMGLYQAGQGLRLSPFSTEEVEERQKVFRSLYIRDRCAAVTRGTPTWLPGHTLGSPSTPHESQSTSLPTPEPLGSGRTETTRAAWCELATLQSELHRFVFVETPQVSAQQRRLSIGRLRQNLEMWSQKHSVPSSTVPTTIDNVSLHLAFLGTRIKAIEGCKPGQADRSDTAQALADARVCCLMLLVSCDGRRDVAWVERLERLLSKPSSMSQALASVGKPHTPASSSPSTPTADGPRSQQQHGSKSPGPSPPLGIQRLAIAFPSAAPFILARNILGMGAGGSSSSSSSSTSSSRRQSFFQAMGDDAHDPPTEAADDIALLQALQVQFRDATVVANSDPDNHAAKVGHVIQVLADIVSAVVDPVRSGSDGNNGLHGHNMSVVDPLLSSAIISPLMDSSVSVAPSGTSSASVAGRGGSIYSVSQLDAATVVAAGLSSHHHLGNMGGGSGGGGGGGGGTTSPAGDAWGNARNNSSTESLSTGSSSASMPLVATPEMAFDISQFIDQMGAGALGAMWEEQGPLPVTPTQQDQNQNQNQSALETTPASTVTAAAAGGAGGGGTTGSGAATTTRRKAAKRARTSFTLDDDDGGDYMQSV